MARISSMNEGMENIKTIESLEEENLKLKKEIDRLNEEYQLLEIIEKDHKELIDKTLKEEINN